MSSMDTRLFLLIWNLSSLISLMLALLHSTRPLIHTLSGPVLGNHYTIPHLNLTGESYLGVPFAKPPVDDLRFLYPVKVDPWKEPLDGSVLPNSCYQVADNFFGDFPGATVWNPNTPVSEDCLYLNIWTPGPGVRSRGDLPVLVWIYGGGFYSGTSTLDIYDGRIVAALHDVIVVSISYRLGVLGLFCLDDPSAPCNVAMYDQIMALEWIRDNIGYFGGDSGRVTLWGESAGAVSATLHLFSPLSADLYSGVILQSSSANAPWATLGIAESMRRSREFAVDYMRCDPRSTSEQLAACLRAVSPSELIEKQWVSRGFLQMPWLPVVDGVFLTEPVDALLRSGRFKKCPVLIGNNLDEASYFLVYEFAQHLTPLGIEPEMTHQVFLESMRTLFHYYPRYGEELSSAFLLDAISFHYTDWSNTENSSANVDALSHAAADCLFVCPCLEFASHYVKQLEIDESLTREETGSKLEERRTNKKCHVNKNTKSNCEEHNEKQNVKNDVTQDKSHGGQLDSNALPKDSDTENQILANTREIGPHARDSSDVKPLEDVENTVSDEPKNQDCSNKLNNKASSFESSRPQLYYYLFSERYESNPWPSRMGVLHGDEVLFNFGHVLSASEKFSEQEKKLSRIMMKYWTNFAKYGDPNGRDDTMDCSSRHSSPPLTVHWHPYTSQTREYFFLNSTSLLNKLSDISRSSEDPRKSPSLISPSRSTAHQYIDDVRTDQDDLTDGVQHSGHTGRVYRAKHCAFWSDYVPKLLTATDDCPSECRCLDLGSIMDCQRSNVRRIPRILHKSIIMDLDHNRIITLANDSFTNALGYQTGKKCLLEIVSLQSNGLTQIEAAAIWSLTELRVLRLGDNRLQSLDVSLFLHSRHLQVLDLHDNWLTALPGESMYHLHNLESLNISFNRLAAPLEMSAGFKYTTQLSNIDLTGNPIQRIESDSFEAMRGWDPSLPRHVNLSHCSLRSLHPRALTSVPHLTTLVLSNNLDLPRPDLHQILADLAMTQWSPRSVKFSEMSIENITELLRRFKPSSLEQLDLSNNRIQAVPRQSFLFMSNLKDLDLSGNEISDFENSAGLVRLERLNLGGNRIIELEERMFEGLHSLKSLDLSHNKLESLSDQILLNLFNLRHLDVSCNRIQSLSITGMGLESLRSLRAAANRLTAVHFIQRLRRLEDLDISLNVIQELPADVFRPGLNIHSANFSLNGITGIHPKAFTSVAIQSLELARNRLTRLDYFGWTSLKRLVISDNRISNISKDFLRNAGDLEELYLNRNNLHELPANFLFLLPNLTVLDLSFNHIGDILSDKYSTMKAQPQANRLEILRLRETGLKTLSKQIIQSFISMRELDISRNNLDHIPAGLFSNLQHLYNLNLAFNRLHQFDSSMMIETLRSLDVSGNPWQCDCDLKSFCKIFISEKGARIFGLNNTSRGGSEILHPSEHLDPKTQLFKYGEGIPGELNNGFHKIGVIHKDNGLANVCQSPNDKTGLPLYEYCLSTKRQCTRFTVDIIAVGLAVTIATIAVVLLMGVCVLLVLQNRKSSRLGTRVRRRKKKRGRESAHGSVHYEECMDETSLASNTNSMTSPVDGYVTSQEALTSSDLAYRNWGDSRLSW